MTSDGGEAGGEGETGGGGGSAVELMEVVSLQHVCVCVYVLDTCQEQEGDKDKESAGPPKDESAKEKKPEPLFEMLSNPARVLPQQVVIRLTPTYHHYVHCMVLLPDMYYYYWFC